MMLAARARKTLRTPAAPELQVGDVLLFDYRVLHRGKANRPNTNRSILVLTFSKPWYKDICNFPNRSMFEAAGDKET
jgi:ectoine hydroxylase-related dioxygenase (phytanoyl-CoA dioxygenase family)